MTGCAVRRISNTRPPDRKPRVTGWRRQGERALWPDTSMARAFLIALTKWAIAHHGDADAKIMLPVGIVGIDDLMNVLRALEKARQRPDYVTSLHFTQTTEEGGQYHA